MFSLCFKEELWSVFISTSLCLVELCRTDEGLLPGPLPLNRLPLDPEDPTLLGEFELNSMLFWVVVIVKVEGFEIAIGLFDCSFMLGGTWQLLVTRIGFALVL